MALAMMLMQMSTATMMTLSSVELITTVTASLQCIMAYNTPIFGCQIGSFTRRSACSDQCKRALETAQSNIRLACASLSTPSGSLINEAQNGNLVEALCGDSDTRPSQIPSNPTVSHTTIKVPSSSCSTSTSKSPSFTRITTTPVESTPEPSETTQTQTSEEESTSSSSSLSTQTPSSGRETQITLKPPTASPSSSVAPATSSQVPGGFVAPPVGGGDPFATPPIFSSARQIECSVVLCAAIIVMAFLV